MSTTTDGGTLSAWGASADVDDGETEYLADVDPAPQTQATDLNEVAQSVQPEREVVDWGECYRRHGTPARMADATGIPESAVRQRLAKASLHNRVELHPDKLERYHPHEIEGLSPLGCGNPDCGAQDIVVHPCPECGFDPRGGATDG